MVQKSKLPRKRGGKTKRKEKIFKKDKSVKDLMKNEDSLPLSKESPQNSENPKPSFVEAKKLSEQLTAPQKEKKDDITIFHPNKYLLFEIVGLLLITVIVYAGTLHHSFHFDDYSSILQNPFIQISTISVDELVKAGFESPLNKRPVANISFALNYYFHGLDVKGYHIVNIIIHLLAGIMLYYFV
jgi:hypothetical protein